MLHQVCLLYSYSFEIAQTAWTSDYAEVNAVPGWWIGLDEARKLSKYQEGAEWWKAALDGCTVEVKQHVIDGPEDAPIWMYNNFDMYLGKWKSGLESGFGVAIVETMT